MGTTAPKGLIMDSIPRTAAGKMHVKVLRTEHRGSGMRMTN